MAVPGAGIQMSPINISEKYTFYEPNKKSQP